MLFNSVEFIFVFLPLAWFVYFFLMQKRQVIIAKGWLTFVSLFFYGYWNPAYVTLISLSILVNFMIGHTLALSYRSTPWGLYFASMRGYVLSIGVSFNLLLLGYYKYTNFLVENLNALGTSLTIQEIILPLGISFFTFTQIAFLVDSYRGEVKEYSLLNYALFVTYFPHLLAGPILHHREMMPQFASKWNWGIRYRNIALGLFIFAMGLFKKVMIADYFAPIADSGFSQAGSLNILEAWAASLSYTFQLYFDFSGYCDMAIGISLMFNIHLPINFNSPYKAFNIQDFWRRWHITLGRFLRDYLYIPLGGNRLSKPRTYFNLIITFLLGGIWHGAGWTFILWGLAHGIALAIHRAWQTLGITLPRVIAWFITFNFVNLSWVFFRSKDLPQAMALLHDMFFGALPPGAYKLWLENLDSKPKLLLALLGAWLVAILAPNSNHILERFKPNGWFMLIFIAIMFACIVHLNRHQAFLYFNF